LYNEHPSKIAFDERKKKDEEYKKKEEIEKDMKELQRLKEKLGV
jgi:hypothetical protein